MSGSLVSTDVLVIGGGLAGERCAIEAAAAGHDVLILSLVPPRRSHSCAAQGGMQASLGNCVKAEGDNATLHFLDTVRGSDWGADQEVAGANRRARTRAFRRALDAGAWRQEQLFHQG
jgi:fumarate reductase flavoprotein subunit